MRDWNVKTLKTQLPVYTVTQNRQIPPISVPSKKFLFQEKTRKLDHVAAENRMAALSCTAVKFNKDRT